MYNFDTSSLSLTILGVVVIAACSFLWSKFKNRNTHTVVTGKSARGESRAVPAVRMSPMHLEIETQKRNTLYARAELNAEDLEKLGKCTVTWHAGGIHAVGPAEISISPNGGKATSTFIEIKLKRLEPNTDVMAVGRVSATIAPEDDDKAPCVSSAAVKVAMYSVD